MIDSEKAMGNEQHKLDATAESTDSRQARRQYRRLVARMAEGYCRPSNSAILEILTPAGKTAVQLAKDIRRYRRERDVPDVGDR